MTASSTYAMSDEQERASAVNAVDAEPNHEKHDRDHEEQSPTPASRLQREGLFAWLQVAGAFVLNLNTWGLLNTFGVFQTFYQLDLLRYETPSNIAWIGSTQAFLLFLVSLGAGPAFDRGYVRPLIWIGSFLFILGMFLVSITSQYWQVFLTQALLMGVGFGCVYLPAPAIVSQYFHTRAALAMGAASTGSAIGGIIYPIIFTKLQPHVGFGWATRVLAFIFLGTSLIPVFLMKSKEPPGPTRNIIDRDAFRDAPYLLFATGLFFGFTGFYIVLNYIQLFAIEHSIPTSIANNVLVIINASSLVGRLGGGFYADKIGSIHAQSLAAFIAAILTYALLAINTAAGLVVYSILFGFTAGTFTGLPATGVVSLSADKTKIGTRLGMVLAYVGVGVLVGNPIAGAILGRNGNWTGLITFCASLLIVSGGTIVASRVMKVGWRLDSKM
ncbi:major facilitator superfamily domain-containing protein [Xylaria cf. heliscus]|nr:major facilitator superfamily domain-containing protein [Xylaria cf. heliscus]